MTGVFPDYPAPVIRNSGEREMVMMRWGMPPPPRTGGPCDQHPQHLLPALARLAQAGEPLLGAVPCPNSPSASVLTRTAPKERPQRIVMLRPAIACRNPGWFGPTYSRQPRSQHTHERKALIVAFLWRRTKDNEP
jgi:hypothetical protein